ncbi:MAG TPA: hypothetical protein H9870_04520 [Candidatus Corynebacterium avicola]|uniref:DUF5067 domain-containing protein n=1 Tax=Candidatus Corynebacterium avicola TaxID=2838527 RepID=A0A9D1RNK9_9CORY|nr:hypothetical protein [Candidatus Corynebacterium avicola]
MTDFKKLRLAIIAGIAVPALALTACSSDDSDSGSDSGSSDSTDSADSGESEDSEGSEDTEDSGESEDSSDDSDDSDSGSSGELEGAPDDFELTEPGSKLSLGEAAYVVTQAPADEESGETSPMQYWKVTAQDLTDVPKEDIEVDDEDGQVEKFICVNYDVEYLGASEEADPEAASAVQAPEFGAVDDSGNGANWVMMSDASDCNIHASDELPYDASELQDGKVYKGAELSYETNDGSGVTATGLEFEYNVEGVEELENADSIFWN